MSELKALSHPTLGIGYELHRRTISSGEVADVIFALTPDQITTVRSTFLTPSDIRPALTAKQLKKAEARWREEHLPPVEPLDEHTVTISYDPPDPDSTVLEIVR